MAFKKTMNLQCNCVESSGGFASGFVLGDPNF
jgi:hypothetical protein